MKKKIIYTNLDNEDFELNEYSSPEEEPDTPYRNFLEFSIVNGNSEFYLLTPEEVDEFCNLLQEKKNEIWTE